MEVETEARKGSGVLVVPCSNFFLSLSAFLPGSFLFSRFIFMLLLHSNFGIDIWWWWCDE